MASPHFLYALLLLQFSVVLANDIHISPATAPVPSHDNLAPSPPPSPPPKVAVQGVVYCKSCKYVGEDTLQDAAPLVGAKVKLRCGYIKETAKTDENGYFFFMPPNLTLFKTHKCKVFLLSSPIRGCNAATNLHDGARGATPVLSSETPSLVLFNVGPFAFEPRRKCH
ncbi:non-classical arabinogalactan protein 30-like [Primulina eburnea]|uniref:non-classical arabinogalactan protein 30-like n=1 Tax=Primulina eburnea TaxID=1245227 RepID=UPI003C6C20B9